jgi:hypothetical protein
MLQYLKQHRELLLNINTPLEFVVYCTNEYWNIVSHIKHPVMSGEEKIVEEVLCLPDEVRQSIRDKQVFLFYKKIEKRYICVVVKRLNGTGFLITAYPTDKIKEGLLLWMK